MIHANQIDWPSVIARLLSDPGSTLVMRVQAAEGTVASEDDAGWVVTSQETEIVHRLSELRAALRSRQEIILLDDTRNLLERIERRPDLGLPLKVWLKSQTVQVCKIQ